jgi:hypothetical protein
VNAEDPVAGRRQGLVRSGPYAAELLEEVLELDVLESEDDEEVEPDDEDEADDEEVDGFDDAGALLDEEPRLSLR